MNMIDCINSNQNCDIKKFIGAGERQSLVFQSFTNIRSRVALLFKITKQTYHEISYVKMEKREVSNPNKSDILEDIIRDNDIFTVRPLYYTNECDLLFLFYHVIRGA